MCIDFIKNILCKSELDMIKKYEARIKDLDNEIINLKEKINQLQILLTEDEIKLQEEIQSYLAEISRLEQEKKVLEDKIKEYEFNKLPDEMIERINYYYNKYPEVPIKYSGRYLGNDVNNLYSIDVRGYVPVLMTWDFYTHLANNKCFVKDIMKEKNCSFWEACDEAVLRVSKSVPVKYEYDNNNFKSAEYWLFPQEGYYNRFVLNRGMDCDDYSILRFVLCRLAGVPAGLLRITCGLTRDGQGHATIHYLKSDKKWYHINSTSNIYSYADWRDKDDVNDKIGIEQVWFSFNDEKSFNQFTTDAMKSFKKNKKYKNKIIIGDSK